MIKSVVIYHPLMADALRTELQARETGLELHVVQDLEGLSAVLAQADALLASPRLPGEVLHHGSRLQWIQVTAAGVDGIAPYLPRGVRLTRLVGTFGPRMAEYVFAYLLALSQDVPRAVRQQQERRWQSFHQSWLYGQTLLVVGVGEIGRVVASLGRALHMKVLGVAHKARRVPGVDHVYAVASLQDALVQAQVIVVTLPLTEHTRGLFGPDEFASMRDDAIFVNIGRGAVVQEDALIAGLRMGHPRAAVLDVFASEPIPSDHVLWTLPNVIITPHLAGHTLASEAVDIFCENLSRFRAGRPLRHQVNRRRGY